MRRKKRTLPVLIGVLSVAAAILVLVELRKHAPPEPVRLLPSGDAFLYINLGWIRRLNALSQLPPVSHDPEYERFIQSTGFQFERDLDRAAFAVHYPLPRPGQAGMNSPSPRYSEVFEGNVHSEKMIAYLGHVAQSVDQYRSIDIFNIPLEGRTLRVALIGVGTIAASNHDDPMVIRGIIDRSRKLASPFAGAAFLRQYYRYVPLASLAWAIVRVPNSTPEYPLAQGIWSLLLPKQADVVISARYLRAVHLRAEAFTASEDDAQRITERLATFLNVFHSAETSASSQGPDPDVKQFFDSLKVEQRGQRAVVTASLPPGFIKKALLEAPPMLAPQPALPTNRPPQAPSKKKRAQ